MSLSTIGKCALCHHMPPSLAAIVIEYIVIASPEYFKFRAAMSDSGGHLMINQLDYVPLGHSIWSVDHVCKQVLGIRYTFSHGTIGQLFMNRDESYFAFVFTGMCCPISFTPAAKWPLIDARIIETNVHSQTRNAQHAYECACACFSTLYDILKRYE